MVVQAIVTLVSTRNYLCPDYPFLERAFRPWLRYASRSKPLRFREYLREGVAIFLVLVGSHYWLMLVGSNLPFSVLGGSTRFPM
jgi:hypothetical protein